MSHTAKRRRIAAVPKILTRRRAFGMASMHTCIEGGAAAIRVSGVLNAPTWAAVLGELRALVLTHRLVGVLMDCRRAALAVAPVAMNATEAELNRDRALLIALAVLVDAETETSWQDYAMHSGFSGRLREAAVDSAKAIEWVAFQGSLLADSFYASAAYAGRFAPMRRDPAPMERLLSAATGTLQ